ncbi:MAG: TPM domain-containing protein [Nevskia sp.]|nr:TPM domain-containing protein [Nevskia sp.]
MRGIPRIVAWLALALCAAAPAHAQVPVPALQARVTDLTGTLSGEQSSALEEKLAAFERDKGSQVAVLLVPSTQPETIEQYGIRVAQAWKLGRKGVDDGAILIVAKDDHRMRIEVGYGLEGALTDATAKRIISEDIAPRFKQGDYYQGIDAGVERMLKVIQGEPLPAPARTGLPGKPLAGTWLIALIFVVLFGAAMRSFKGALAAGGIVGAIVWFATGVLAVAGIAAVIGFLVSLVFWLGSSGGGWGGPYRGYGGGYRGGGFGGGGFSGGGGGFGGGGASGSW